MARPKKQTNRLTLKQIFTFLTTKRFLFHLLAMVGTVLLILLGTLFIIKIYTNHGQKLELPDYLGQDIDIATDDARRRSFKIIVNDSIHRLGVVGGEILNQNPKPLSMVKENRKIYVTISKFTPDFLLSDYLPEMYGRDFEMKKRELENQDIYVEIKDYQYDNAEPNTILEVWYEGKQIINRSGRKNGVEIEKGSTVELVLSQNSGGLIDIPNVTCQQYSKAEFTISSYRLKVGEIVRDGNIRDLANSWILRQEPSPDTATEIQMGDSITLYVTQDKPEYCP